MEQKIAMMLVALLLKGPSHPRALARSLGLNHMTVVRSLRSLVDGNVLDYSVSGRNKVYRIKRTMEARNAVMMAELYRLDMLVKAHPFLRRIVSRVMDDERFDLAVLFGSYVKGTASKDSDVDLYVETSDLSLKADLEKLSGHLSVKIGVYDRTNPLIREIEHDHVIIKGFEAFYGHNRFFKEAP